MNRDDLLDRLTQDVFAYVMHGGFPEDRFVGKVRYEGLDERFDDFESLVRLHFVLRPEVVQFVEELPNRIRSVKTQTRNVSSTNRGRVDGRIDWSATIRERYSRAPGDASLFVCDNRTESYDIDENVVLKRLLSIIYNTLRDCETHLKHEYEWVTERWRKNLELVDILTETFERNVHVTRIRDPKEYEPTERMLQTAEESRNEIYRETAGLLREYEDAASGDRDAIRTLLDETAITPDDDETLLELFVLFRYIRAIEELRSEEFSIRTIESGSQEVARMEGDDAEFVLYHDQSARDRGVTFITEEKDADEDDLSRAEMVKRRAKEVEADYFSKKKPDPWTNRPDVIVLEIRTEDQLKYLITEVKNSIRQETVRQGIEETLEYLAFLRQDDEFLFDRDTKFFGNNWNGLLVIQDIEDVETQSLDDQESIKILQASEVESRIKDVLKNAVQG